MDLGLAGRAYIITGGTAGLGRATVKPLVDEGASVVVSSRTAAKLEKVQEAFGDSVVGVAADNADSETPDTLVRTAQRSFGRIDGLLVSVGGPPRGSTSEVTDEDWRRAFESVFLGAVRLARRVAEELPPSGAIGLVLSSSVYNPITNLAISNGLRPGLAMIIKTLADEFGPRGIRVVGLVPGRIETARTAELDQGNPEARGRSESAIPLRRLGEPSEFGRVAAFVLSPAASYITGSMITIDGGMIRSV